MIKIIITKNNNKEVTNLNVNGHANHDKYGNDIVCAAISTLIQFAREFLDVYSHNVKIEYKDGQISNFKINNSIFPINNLFQTMVSLLEDVEEQYPLNLKLEVRDDDISGK